MTTLRCILGIVGGAAAGYAIAALFLLTDLDFGVAVAISAACVLGIFLIRAIQADQAYGREQMRRGRDAIWQRTSHHIERKAS